MTKEEAIKFLQQIYPNGGHCWLDEQRMEAIGMAIKALQEEPVSENLEEACEQLAENARKHKAETSSPFFSQTDYKQGVMDGAKWQKENLWKLADGDDLPEIDREVVALTQPYPNDEHLRVVFAHRPSKYAKVWNSDLGEEQVVEIEGYDKGGWNIPDVKYWLDIKFPNE